MVVLEFMLEGMANKVMAKRLGVTMRAIERRRQRKVLDRAVKSTAVVSSLFPDAVRDQLYRDISEDLGLEKRGKEWGMSEELSRSIELALDEHNPQPRKQAKPKGKVIAKKYPETTVFFMDLAGFTGMYVIFDTSTIDLSTSSLAQSIVFLSLSQ